MSSFSSPLPTLSLTMNAFSARWVATYLCRGKITDSYFLTCLHWNAQTEMEGKQEKDELLALYGEIEKAVEIYSSLEGSRTITIMIDDVSLMEVAANGSSNHVLDFLHYCYTLKANYGCSFVTLNHEDIYSRPNMLPLILQPEYLADVIIKAEPLATGLARDVHGQLTVLNKGSVCDMGSSSSKVRNFHFRIKENNVDYFYPGTQT